MDYTPYNQASLGGILGVPMDYCDYGGGGFWDYVNLSAPYGVRKVGLSLGSEKLNP